MTKIFISHSSDDSVLVNDLMALIQLQFNLARRDFFNTSDEQLPVGGDWIANIQKGMQEATLVMPIITPRYLESAFCLCELGAAWINNANPFPIIVPPLTYKALDGTPYRAWMQTISLESEDGLTRLFDAFVARNIGHEPNVTRFLRQVRTFREQTLAPFIVGMNARETATPALVKQLKAEAARYKDAYEKSENELDELKIENEKLREMKDAEQVKEMEFAKMDEWDAFYDAVEQVKISFRDLNLLGKSLLYYDIRKLYYTPDDGGSSGLVELENKGMAQFNDEWEPDYGHSYMKNAREALDELGKYITENKTVIQGRFDEEYPGVRLGLEFTPFWENVLDVKVLRTA